MIETGLNRSRETVQHPQPQETTKWWWWSVLRQWPCWPLFYSAQNVLRTGETGEDEATVSPLFCVVLWSQLWPRVIGEVLPINFKASSSFTIVR